MNNRTVFPLFWLYFFVLGIVGCKNDSKSSIGQIIEERASFFNKMDHDKWPSVLPKDQNIELDFHKNTKEKLLAVDYEHLSKQDKISYDLLDHITDDRIANLTYQSYLIPINSEGGFLAGVVYNIGSKSLNTSENQSKYLEYLESLDQYLDDQTSNLSMGIELNKTASKHIVSKFLKILRETSEQEPEHTIFYTHIGEANVSEDYKQQVLKVISEKILPAYKKLDKFISTSYYPKSLESTAAKDLPDGENYYKQRVQYFTTLEISPEEVFNKGKSEVARIKKEMEVIIQEIGFDGSYDEFLEFLRTDEQFYAKTGEELLHKAAWISKSIEAKLPKYFGTLPRLPFTVQPVPDAIAPNYTGGRYSEGSIKDRKAGEYWVNTYNLNSRPLYILPALTLHEAVPGHHLQISLTQELDNLPEFRRSFYLSAFGEGWALYTEWLGEEMGIYTNPYELFGKLTYEMWRACRLVVDVGLHYYGWERDRAVKFLGENTALSLHEVNTEIDRYIGWPAQALSYKMGELKIRELRAKAETQLGDRFDISSFHDLVLSNGTVPLTTLDRIVNEYILDFQNKKQK